MISGQTLTWPDLFQPDYENMTRGPNGRSKSLAYAKGYFSRKKLPNIKCSFIESVAFAGETGDTNAMADIYIQCHIHIQCPE